jgi:hypothetical protein
MMLQFFLVDHFCLATPLTKSHRSESFFSTIPGRGWAKKNSSDSQKSFEYGG